MLAKVSLDKEVFDTNIAKVRSNLAEVELSTSKQLSVTDIEPFVSYASMISEFKNLVKQYKSLTNGDITKIEKMGEKLVKTDEEISSKIKSKTK